MPADSEMQRDITIESEERAFDAYLSLPPTGHGPGVLVIQEWWGLVPQIRSVCDRFARAGFVALAPDLYRGDATTDPGEGARLMMDLEIHRAGRDLVHAVAALRNQSETEGPRIGCIGFCMGGQLALHAACLVPEIGAVVDCYGVHPNVSLDLASCKAKVLGVFAENDAFIAAADVQSLSDALDDAGVESKLQTYLGVQHAFLNEARPEAFDADTASEAWRDIDSFLAAELR